MLPTLRAQSSGVPPQPPVQKDQPWGKTVKAIRIVPNTLASKVSGYLKTLVDKPLSQELIQEDLHQLYQRLELKARVESEPMVGGVLVRFHILPEERLFDRLKYVGMKHLQEDNANFLVGRSKSQRISRPTADRYRLILQDHYRRDGYYFCNITIKEDKETSTLTLVFDEGPKVLVDRVTFRGNKSYPADVLFSLSANLIGGAALDNKPRSGLSHAYSEQAVAEDLEKLRLYYRRRGYRDAMVELEQRTFVGDGSRVDLAYRIVEGRRYRIAAVQVKILDDNAKPTVSRYPMERIRASIHTKPGEFFSRDAIMRDIGRLEEFYGELGHPSRRTVGNQLTNALEIIGPEEVYSFNDNAEITLVYTIREGQPKRVREVMIHGAKNTKGRVVRRSLRLMEGDLLDMKKFKRSVQLLNALRYFNDPRTLVGPRIELLPVKDQPGMVDVHVHVREGDTGRFIWGAGFSSGSGVRGTFRLTKSNFDLMRPPSSWNPATWISEIIDGEAFHGAGQTLDLSLSPGTEVSTFQLSWYEPDIFRQHIDTIGMRVNGRRTIRRLDTFDSDELAGALTLSRIFSENFRVGATFRQQTVDIENVAADAPTIVYLSEGKSEMRGLEVFARWSDLDSFIQPREGYGVRFGAELIGGIFGASEDFYRFFASAEYYQPLHEDPRGRKHVLFFRGRLDTANTFGGTNFLFPSERFYLGGSNLRGFEQREAGPKQFGNPVGGEARALGTLEYQFPLVSTRMEGHTRETEILRGVLFSDVGMLGLSFGDEEFRRTRVSVGFGLRILIPVLQLPVQLDFGWPILSERTDEREILYLTFSQRY